MIAPAEQVVALHTHSGVPLSQYQPSEQVDLKWTRQLRDVSSCDLSIASGLSYGELPDLTPWLHWISVWGTDPETLLWSGPIQKVTANRDSIKVSAKDVAALTSRTRCPLTKRWDAVDPSTVAAELWAAMIEAHGLHLAPIVRPDPEGDRYSFGCTADAAMLESTMTDLTNLGLKWTVVGGVPILGPAPLAPVVALGEADFLGGMEITRDGSASYNDILLRGADDLARAHREMGGLNLQTIVNIDNMFGVSNVDKAVLQYAKYTSRIRDALSLPNDASLHPDAPVHIDQLIPSARFVVEGYGLRTLMELESVTVTCSDGNTRVSVNMESVDVPGGRDTEPELMSKARTAAR